MRRALAVAVATVLAVPVGLATMTGAAQPASFDPAVLRGEIPVPMLAAYLDAAAAWQVDWALLAAIGKLECDHARSLVEGCWPPGTVNASGARGPMQFLGSTWRVGAAASDREVAGPPTDDGQGYATDGDGDGLADPWSTADAVHAAGRYLVDLGARDDPRRAARSYNAGPHNPNPTAGESYATRVVELIGHYHALAGGEPDAPDVAAVIDRYALPFDPAGLLAVTADRASPRDPEWALVKPHHSGRVAADIPLLAGTALYALVGGTVTFAGLTQRCGNTVSIRNDIEHATVTYCHLSHIDVRSGDTVHVGRWIGRSGGEAGTPGAGNSTGPHLHLHIDTPSGRRCPQAVLLGLWRGWPVPTIATLRTSGCTYAGAPSLPQSPVPVPPDLPIPATVPS